MFWQYSRIPRWVLIVTAVIGLVLTVLIELTLSEIKRPYFDEKLAASNKMLEAENAIREFRQGENILIDEVSDINQTGCIGEEFTLLTTDQGDLEAKLTATNPNFAAIVIKLLKEAGVQKDDYVAVAWTGSFPGANIATVAAIDVIGAKPVIITSIGSSMWGANIPDLTWLDMEKIINDAQILSYRSVAASIGGRGDRGGNISPAGRELARTIIYDHGVDIIDEQFLSRSIERRMKIYNREIPDGFEYKAYVNVGGGLGSIGSAHNLVIIPHGLTMKILPENYPRKGTMIKFGEQDVPIINLININELAKEYNLPIAPEPIPTPPDGGIYYRKQYNLYAVGGALLIYIVLLFFIIKRKAKK